MDLTIYKSRDPVPVNCNHCAKEFTVLKKAYMTATKHDRNLYCSRECQANHRRLKELHCAECHILFKPNESSQRFCCQSCAAKFNNRGVDRTTTGRCKCGARKANQANQCKRCGRDESLVLALKQTLADVDLADKGYKGSQRWNTVRKLARRVIELEGRDMKCEYCDFDAHIEVCHIQPISSFKLSAPLIAVNHPSNLKLLCPNHHWLLDNGKLVV